MCKDTNYIVPLSSYIWTISSYPATSLYVYYILSGGNLQSSGDFYGSSHQYAVHPALYLKSGILFGGEGTEGEPYTINTQNQ